MSEIGERVKKIVVEHLGVEPEKVVDSASFIDDLGADSLDTVELVMAFEEEFGCEIPDDAAETILTVGDATKFLEKNEMPWTHWHNGSKGGMLDSWNIRFFPTIYVVDAKGVIRFKGVRGQAMDDAVDKLLK